MPQFATLQERLAALKEILPKELILPEGLLGFVTEIDSKRNPRNLGDEHNLFLNEDSYVWTGNEALTYRTFLVNTCMIMGMDFTYDPKRDAVVADFAWHMDDPRSSEELLQLLMSTKPWDKEDNYGPVDKIRFPDSFASDPWRLALNALISKPENYARAWKLRFLEDMRSSEMLPTSGQLLWSGMLPGTGGEPVFVVIKYHPALSTKGPTACFASYVFDTKGRFQGGSIMSDTYEDYRAMHVGLSVSKAAVFLLRDTDLKGNFAVGAHGIEFQPDPAHTFSGDQIGKVLYRAE